jgi:hypothetical protein
MLLDYQQNNSSIMKKLIALAFTLALFTGCQNEPIDSGFSGVNEPTDPGNTGGGTGTDTGNSDLTLSTYTYDVTTTLPIFGETVLNTDFTMNTNNKVSTQDTEVIVFGTTILANATLTRDGSGNITTIKNFSSGAQINQTDVTYTAGNISTIAYDDFEDDSEDYTYTFTTTGNEINRTETGSAETVTYTFNTNSKLIKKEYFDGGTSQQIETLTYDAAGNCTQSEITGGFNNSVTTYGFDSNINPLKAAFNDQYLFGVLDNDAEAQAASLIVLFNSTNNWNSITTIDGTSTFTVQYNAANRIMTRDGSFDLGDGVTVSQSEVFNYVN